MALRKLEGTSYQEEARLALLSIYERSRDWGPATEIAGKLDGSSRGSFGVRQAHYLCEQALASVAAGNTTTAKPHMPAMRQTAQASGRRGTGFAGPLAAPP